MVAVGHGRSPLKYGYLSPEKVIMKFTRINGATVSSLVMKQRCIAGLLAAVFRHGGSMAMSLQKQWRPLILAGIFNTAIQVDNSFGRVI